MGKIFYGGAATPIEIEDRALAHLKVVIATKLRRGESFTLSLLTAILLKVALEVVIALKSRVIKRFHAATTRRGRIAAALSLWVVAAGSKLVVLELVALVFRDAVSLGGFIPVTLLVVTLLLSRAAVRRLLYGAAAAD